MHWLRAVSAAFVALTFLINASPHAEATVLKTDDQDRLVDGRPFAPASGSSGAREAAILAASERLADEQERFDETSTAFQDPNGNLRSMKEAQKKAMQGWTVETGDSARMARFGDMPPETAGDWFQTSTFDGVTAGNGWLLSGTANYYHRATEGIGFDPVKLLSVADDWLASAGGSVDVTAREDGRGASGGGFGLHIPALIFLLGLIVCSIGLIGARRSR